jgi:F-type H+-transporting ATPase subunit a
MLASGFSWFHLLPAVDHDTLVPFGHSYVYLHTAMVCLGLILFAVVARMGLERAKARQGLERFYTSERFSPLVLAELLADSLRGLMGDLLSKDDVRLFFPLISAFFLYIFGCNILGIFPGFLPPTDYVNANAGLALITFVTFNVVGLARDPVGYVKHLWGPVWWLGVLLFPIEVLSLFIRPVSLTIRLTANMFGDHLVFNIMSGLVPLLLPVGLLALAILVSTIQAFIFSLLTTIYISLSVPHGHDHHGSEHDHAH